MNEANVERKMRVGLWTMGECRNVQISAIIPRFQKKDKLSVKFSLPNQMPAPENFKVAFTQ